MIPPSIQTPGSAGLVSHLDLVDYYRAQYEAGIESGRYEPVLWPLISVPTTCALLYLVFPPQNPRLRFAAKYVVFTISLCHMIYCMKYQRSTNVASCFGAGLVPCWFTLWIARNILVHDPFTEFNRVVWAEQRQSKSKENPNGTFQVNEDAQVSKASSLRLRSVAYRKEISALALPDQKNEVSSPHHYAWQAYPQAYYSRLTWSLDLLYNFRGISWNWHVPSVYPVPAQLLRDLDYQIRVKLVKPSPSQPTTSRQALLWTNLRLFVFCYFILDILKNIGMRDPYFLTLIPETGSASAPSWLPAHLHAHPWTPVFLRCFRLMYTQLGVATYITYLFSLGTLFFVFLIGPGILGAAGEPWVYPPAWAPYSATALDGGLASWWGVWWHQSFRAAFDAMGVAAVAALGLQKPAARVTTMGAGKIAPAPSEHWVRRMLRRWVRLCAAFVASGMLHATGSFTMYGESRPVSGSFAFFAVQPFAIMAEAAASSVLHRIGLAKRTPKWASRVVKLVFIYTWFYFTGPLLADDFARQGLWLFEPIPVSPLRAMGLGINEDWWCWGRLKVQWWTGKRWWQSGLYL